jgi:hypothetical protein
MFWLGSHAEALAMPLSLNPGQYSSEPFRTWLVQPCQIQIYLLPFDRTPIDLDWRIVDAKGAVLQSGTYRDPPGSGGNGVNLGKYSPRWGREQRVLVTVHKGEDVPGVDAKLHIGDPEILLDNSYGLYLYVGWALAVLAAGAIGEFAYRLARKRRNATS